MIYVRWLLRIEGGFGFKRIVLENALSLATYGVVTSDPHVRGLESRLGYPCGYVTPNLDEYDRGAGFLVLSGTAGKSAFTK